MHIHRLRSGKYQYALLRESFRHGGKVKKRTLANLSKWTQSELAELENLLDKRRGRGGILHERELDAFLASRLMRDTDAIRVLTLVESIKRGHLNRLAKPSSDLGFAQMLSQALG